VGKTHVGWAHCPVGVNRESRSADSPWKVPWALRLINCSGGGALLREEMVKTGLGAEFLAVLLKLAKEAERPMFGGFSR
jgi:hypothetical protein